MSDRDGARRRREEREKLLQCLSAYGEGAPYSPETEEVERESERDREIERNRRPEPGTTGFGALGGGA